MSRTKTVARRRGDAAPRKPRFGALKIEQKMTEAEAAARGQDEAWSRERRLVYLLSHDDHQLEKLMRDGAAEAFVKRFIRRRQEYDGAALKAALTYVRPAAAAR